MTRSCIGACCLAAVAGLSGCAILAGSTIALAASSASAAQAGYAFWSAGSLTYADDQSLLLVNEAFDWALERLAMEVTNDKREPLRSAEDIQLDEGEHLSIELARTRTVRISDERGHLGTVTLTRLTERMTMVKIRVGPLGSQAKAKLIADEVYERTNALTPALERDDTQTERTLTLGDGSTGARRAGW